MGKIVNFKKILLIVFGAVLSLLALTPNVVFADTIESTTELNVVAWGTNNGDSILGLSSTGDFSHWLIVIMGTLLLITFILLNYFVKKNKLKNPVISVSRVILLFIVGAVTVSCVLCNITNAAAEENIFTNKSIEVRCDINGGPITYGDGEQSNKQYVTNNRDNPVFLNKISINGDKSIGQWTATIESGKTIFNGTAGAQVELEEPILLNQNESIIIIWNTSATSESLLPFAGTVPATINYSFNNPTHMVHFETNGGSPQPEDQIVTTGSLISKPVDPLVYGYYFKGWYKEKELENQWDFETDIVNENVNLYAKYSAKTDIPAVFNAGEGHFSDGTNTKIIEQTFNEKYQLPETPEREGYAFNGWIDEDDNPITSGTIVTTENPKIKTTWKINHYTTTIKGDENIDYFLDDKGNKITTIDGDYGTIIKIKPVTKNDYNIDQIKDEGGNTYAIDNNGYFDYIIKGNYQITVTTTKNEFYAIKNTDEESWITTLTFYYDDKKPTTNDTTITIYDNLPTNAQKAEDWPYYGSYDSYSKVQFDESVNNYCQLKSTAYMLYNITANDLSGCEYINTSNVTNMSHTFDTFGGDYGEIDHSPDVSNWDMSKVTDISYMFNSYANNYYGGIITIKDIPDVSKWDTSNVTNMAYTFAGFGEYKDVSASPDVSNWDTSKVINFSHLFDKYGRCSTLIKDPPDVTNFDLSNATDISYMFAHYSTDSYVEKQYLVDPPNVSKWNTNKVQNFSYIFSNYGANSADLKSPPDVSNWDTSNATNMSNMFAKYAEKSSTITMPPNVTNFNLSNVTDISYMFSCYNGTIYDTEVISKIDTPPDVSNWEINNVTTIEGAFQGYASGSNVLSAPPDVSKWNTSNVVNMNNTFQSYAAKSPLICTPPDVSKWNTSKVTTIDRIFCCYCEETPLDVTTPDMSNWDVSNNGNLNSSFCAYGMNASHLTDMDLSNWKIKDFLATSDTFKLYGAKGGKGSVIIYASDWNEKATCYGSQIFEWSGLKGRTSGDWDSADTKYNGCFSGKINNVTAEIDDTTHGSIDLNEIKDVPYGTTYSINENVITINTPEPKTITFTPSEGCLLMSWLIDNSYAPKNGVITGTTDFQASTIKETQEAYSVWATSETTVSGTTVAANSLNFFYDTKKWAWDNAGCTSYYMNTGKNDPEWIYNGSSVESVNISDSFKNYKPESCYSWFINFNNSKFTNIDLTNLDTSSATNLNGIFYGCDNLTSIDVTKFDTSQANDISYMFFGCTKLTTLNLTNFNIDKVEDTQWMFYNCINLTDIYCNNNWAESALLTSSDIMFGNCEKLPNWDSSYIDKTYAYPSTGSLGYFTEKKSSNCSSAISLNDNENIQQNIESDNSYNNSSSDDNKVSQIYNNKGSKNDNIVNKETDFIDKKQLDYLNAINATQNKTQTNILTCDEIYYSNDEPTDTVKGTL